MKLSDIAEAVAGSGLRVLGGLSSEAAGLEPGRTMVLVGNAGGDMWRVFSGQRPSDEVADPLDDWTRVRLNAIAEDIAGRFAVAVETLFPFDGPPYHPFQRWALACGGVHPSPIGPLIDPEFGLWHGYRGALLVDCNMRIPETIVAASPCDTCAEKPCLAACPVSAFDTFAQGGLDVAACTGHLASGADDCFAAACLARSACPVGTKYAYSEAQARFHMSAFFKTHR